MGANDWQQVSLGQLLTQHKEYVYELDDKEYPKLSVKLYGKGCFVNGSALGSEVKMQKHQLAKAGQVILSEIWGKKGAIGFVPNDGEGALVTSHFFLFDLDKSNIDHQWLNWLCRANYFETELSVQAKGTTGYAAVRPKQFLELTIPLPPLDEQRRIVRRIDALAERISETIDLQREARNESEALLNASLYSIFNPEATKYWKEIPLEEISEIVSGVTLGRRLQGLKLSVPYLRVANVQDGRLDLSEVKLVDIRPHELERWRLQPGDLVLTEGGDMDKLGRGTIWRDEINDCIHQNHIFRVRLIQSFISPEFLELEIRSPYGKDFFLEKAKKTTNLASINQTQLRAFPVKYPDAYTQKKIVSDIQTLAQRIRSLKEEQLRSEFEINTLLPAVLERAFRGELYIC